MRCRVCGKDDQRESQVCRFCGATVRSILGKGMPLPADVIDELRGGREEKFKRETHRRKSRLLWHAAAGAFILFGVLLLVNVASFLLVPRRMLLGILKAIPIALIFGPPIGLITSWRNYGPVGGAIVAALFFAVGTSLIGGDAITYVLVGTVSGMFIGGLIGFHVRSDND